MKKLLILLFIVSTKSMVVAQNNAFVQVYIDNYKPTDTIKIDDLLRIGEISVNNNQFSIVSFSLVFMDRGFLQEYKANSSKLTDEMRSALVSLKSKNIKSVKILFENIVIRTPQNIKTNLGILIYKLKL